MILKKVLTSLGVMALTCMTFAGVINTNVVADEVDEVDLSGTYHARVGIQGTSADGVEWIQRLGYYSGDNMDEDPTVLSTTDDKGSYEFIDQDTEIAGNGTYSVALIFNEEVPIEIIKQLMVVTDIPNSDKIKYTDLRVEINGTVAATFERNVYVDEDDYADNKDCLLVWNDWRNDLVATSPFSVDNKPTDVGTAYILTFTVSGFDYDKVEKVTANAEDLENYDSSNDAKDEGMIESPHLIGEKTSSQGPNVGLIFGILVGVIVVFVILLVLALKKKKY